MTVVAFFPPATVTPTSTVWQAILRLHLPPDAVEPSVALLTGGVLVRVAFQGRPATKAFVKDLVDRVLASSGHNDTH
jgi:hypothetical protein